MGFVLSSLKKDIARWRQDATAILLWISVPLLIGGILTLLMSGSGAKPHGVLLIADQDDSLLSSLVAGAYSKGELAELISVEKVSAAVGREKINAGKASALLIIPRGFSDAFMQSEPVTLTLRTNPSQTILPGIITDVTRVLLDIGFYAEQLFGSEIETIRQANGNRGLDDARLAALSIAIWHKIESVAPYLFPPAIDVDIVEPPPDEPGVPFALLFLPGTILMAVMFAANGLAGDYWAEHNQGTLRRLVSTPARVTGFLAGKALAAGLIITMTGGLVLIIGFLYHGITWDKLPSSLAWIFVSGIGLFAWFGALQMMASSQRAANLLTSMLLFPLLMVGGSFFPFAALPNWIAEIGRNTPNGFIVDRLTREITATSVWAIDLQSWLIVIAMVVSGLAVCAWRLKAGFARG